MFFKSKYIEKNSDCALVFCHASISSQLSFEQSAFGMAQVLHNFISFAPAQQSFLTSSSESPLV